MRDKILIVDDEADIVSMLKDYFEFNGYDTITAVNGLEAIQKAEKQPDIILLDINMPDIDGMEVCMRIRDFVSCPILFLTARIEDGDKIKGFGVGADDYIIKPFSIDELGARVAAHLRRERRQRESAKVRFDDKLAIDYTERSLYYNGEQIPLAKKEFDIIELLSQHNIAGNDQRTARSVNDMRKMMKTGMVFFMVMLVLMTQHVTADAKAKVLNKKMTIDLNKDSAGIRFAPTKLKKYSKVKVSVKNKKVLKAKANGRKYIYLKGKAGGRTTMMIRLYKGHKKVRVYRYSIKVIGKGQDGYKAQAKKAFTIQNRYRAEKGAKALTWSDKLYRFALYRLKHSGYDGHKNLPTDMENFFGDILVINNISFGENMASGQTSAKEVMLSWKHSPGHYRNIKNKGYH